MGTRAAISSIPARIRWPDTDRYARRRTFPLQPAVDSRGSPRARPTSITFSVARRSRAIIPGVPLHITQRGNDRVRTFHSDDDYAHYRRILAEVAGDAGCAIHAWVLMPNHVHLLVTPRGMTCASQMMRRVGIRYVRYIATTSPRAGTPSARSPQPDDMGYGVVLQEQVVGRRSGCCGSIRGVASGDGSGARSSSESDALSAPRRPDGAILSPRRRRRGELPIDPVRARTCPSHTRRTALRRPPTRAAAARMTRDPSSRARPVPRRGDSSSATGRESIGASS